MKATLKKLNMRGKTSILTLEHDSTEKSIIPHDEVMAIAILLGGYNEFGRKIDVLKYQEIRGRFNDCINEIKNLL
jgi:hypothetical protein